MDRFGIPGFDIFYMRPIRRINPSPISSKPNSRPAATVPGPSSDYLVAKNLELTVGAKINSVLGYPGGTEADLAVEKGEIVCCAHTVAAHFGREPFNTWHKNGFDRHLLQTGCKRDPRAADAPTIYEVLEEFKVPYQNRRTVKPCDRAVNSAGRSW